MKLVAEAGTDAAGVVLFAPEALPEDFDARHRRDPRAVLEDLAAAGRLFQVDTGADGEYSLHLYLDEPLPGPLAAHCADLITAPAFAVPDGILWFSGVEYVFRTDDALLRRSPGMGTRLEIPAGTYAARFWRCEYPDEHVEDQVRQALGEREYRRLDMPGCLVGVALALTLVAVGGVIGSRAAAWSLLLAALAVGTWAGLYRVLRSPRYQALTEAQRAIERQYPSFAVELLTQP
jgi:hypothetical protein